MYLLQQTDPLYKNINLRCWTIMDTLGYSQAAVAGRANVADKMSAALALTSKQIHPEINVDKTLAGSFKDGVSLHGESDIDVLNLFTDINCIEMTKLCNADKLNEEKVTFLMDMKNASAGYAILRLDSHMADVPKLTYFKSALTELNGAVCLSSEKFMTKGDDILRPKYGWVGRSSEHLPRQGPSLPERFVSVDNYDMVLDKILGDITKELNTEKDCVRALPCQCPSILKDWSATKMTVDWPTADMVSMVTQLPVYLVPVGRKGSNNEALEWRFSFNQAEGFLVHQFNETQTKVYVFTREIVKTKIKPHCSVITSYVVKNLMFWTIEDDPSRFQQENFLDCLYHCLNRLLIYTEQGVLPCFMIPGRNLLDNMADFEQNIVTQILTEILTHKTCQIYEDTLLEKLENTRQRIAIDKLHTAMLDEMTPIQISDLAFENLQTSESYKIHWNNMKTMFLPLLRTQGLRSLMTLVETPVYSADEEKHAEQHAEGSNRTLGDAVKESVHSVFYGMSRLLRMATAATSAKNNMRTSMLHKAVD